MIVLDTNVLSELMRPAPSPQVVNWLDIASANTEVAVTAITVAEILYGIERMPDGRRKTQLAQRASAMFDEDFAGDILAFDEHAATIYAQRVAACEANGSPGSMADAQIGAICLREDASLATRNIRDFEALSVTLINPWTENLL
ncbi:type II toxin-antitoxin system VapC family toxin [uncultured Salinisphaera sp.]|uniref:type II toxin-antitoxin system VapC family toxin n=1 Tax=uncultured Salinisphaera sp. TaxID=359372 RepID=UPI0032B2EACC|tara:strand:+ start:2565 stop:2996 length:432 start_codon:yes stop_codon:yes gene_type:complete